jgi:hypothetical protein
MRNTDPSSRLGVFLQADAGSVMVATALLAIAILSLLAFAGLELAGVMVVPRLFYMVLGVIVLVAGWDLLRERRKAGKGR